MTETKRAKNYRITNLARIDLEGIWLFTFENWSRDQANNYYETIINKIIDLAQFPNLGKSIDHVSNGLRMFPIKSHVIFYVKNNHTIEVIRILHKHMDIKSRLD